MIDKNEKVVLDFIKKRKALSSKEVYEGFSESLSYATIKRLLVKLIDKNLVIKEGNGKSTKYSISTNYEILSPIEIEKYFEKENDERDIKNSFNFKLIS